MENRGFRTDMRALVVIVTPILAEVTRHIFREANTEVRYEIDGEGTASREWMDVLGLGSAAKKILIGILPAQEADELAAKLNRSLPLKKAGNGIVFTVAAEKMKDFAQCQKDETALKDAMAEEKICYLISIIANRGCSDAVMDAARTMGASGGTVIHGEAVRHHALVRAWGLRHSETKEIILILSEASKVMGLMRAVTEQCGSDEKVQARAYASHVDQVYGLNYYLQ